MTAPTTPEAVLAAAIEDHFATGRHGWSYESCATAVVISLPPGWCGHEKLADHELIPLLESCTYDIPISAGDVSVLSSRLAHSPVRLARRGTPK
jgi:hypothetical protein